MALPSESKRGCDETCDQRVGRGNLFIFFPSYFSPSYPVLIGVQATHRPESSASPPGSRSGFDELWLMTTDCSSHYSLRTPNKRSQNLCLVFICQKGAFGNKNGSWVLDFVGLMEGAPLDWSEFAKGFCTGVLGRTPNFQVVASGSQQEPRIQCLYKAYPKTIDRFMWKPLLTMNKSQ